MKIVLQKFIAESGLCSRRNSEDLIRSGRVKVNGIMAELGMKAGKDDVVTVDDKKISLPKKMIYIKLNKPAGYVSTSAKFKDEKNVFELIDTKERLFAVGRLDKNSRGLMILTNDGELTQKLTHPSFKHEKEYVVKISNAKNSLMKDLICAAKKVKSGIDIGEGDGLVKAKKAEYLGAGNFKVILTDGKKRQIRRMFKMLGMEIEDLIRVRIGNLELGNLKEGEWKYLEKYEVDDLKC